jgi:hypothetical protein
MSAHDVPALKEDRGGGRDLCDDERLYFNDKSMVYEGVLEKMRRLCVLASVAIGNNY